MQQYKDVFTHHIFNELNAIDLSRLREANRFFEEIIDKQVIMEKVLVWFNSVLSYSFGNDTCKFKQMLVDYYCVVLWHVNKGECCGINIEILGCKSFNDEIIDTGEANDIDLATQDMDLYFSLYISFIDYMSGHNYKKFAQHGINKIRGSISGTFLRNHPDLHEISIKWFSNNSIMEKCLSDGQILSRINSYSICKESGKEVIVMPNFL